MGAFGEGSGLADDPATGGFVPGDGAGGAVGGQGAGDALAGGADQRGDVALGKADIDADAFAVGLGGSLGFGEAEEAVGDAACHVAGHQHFRPLVLVADPLGEYPQECPRDGGLLGDRFLQGVSFQQQQLDRFQCADVGGARAAVNRLISPKNSPGPSTSKITSSPPAVA